VPAFVLAAPAALASRAAADSRSAAVSSAAAAAYSGPLLPPGLPPPPHARYAAREQLCRGREQLRHRGRELRRSAEREQLRRRGQSSAGRGEADPAGEVVAMGAVPAPKQDGGGSGACGKDGRGMPSRHRSV